MKIFFSFLTLLVVFSLLPSKILAADHCSVEPTYDTCSYQGFKRIAPVPNKVDCSWKVSQYCDLNSHCASDKGGLFTIPDNAGNPNSTITLPELPYPEGGRGENNDEAEFQRNCQLALSYRLPEVVPVDQGGTGGEPAPGGGEPGLGPVSNPALDPIFGQVNAPSQLEGLLGSSTGEEGVGIILSRVIELIYIFGSVIFVFYVLYSAIQFIYSEGHKESVAEARARIIWAIVGIVILALAFVLLRVLGKITGFTFFGS